MPTPVAPAELAKGLPADQAKVVLKSATEGAHMATVSLKDRLNARSHLLHQIQNDLKQRRIPAEMDEQSGTLYLPGLLDFKSDTLPFTPEKQQGMRELAAVLAKHLPCFTQQASQRPGCAESSEARLDTLVIAGNAGSAPVGSGAFRHNWDLANARALATFAELLEAHPALNNLRNTREQSLFRLDGFLPPEGATESKGQLSRPLRRVELRFVMDPAAHESHPPQ